MNQMDDLMQPEALRLADAVEYDPLEYADDAAAELRRLHEAKAELLEALQACRAHMYEHASNTPDGAFDKLCAAIAKHGGAHD